MPESRSLADAVEEIQDPKLREQARKLLREDPRNLRGFAAFADESGRAGFTPWQKTTTRGTIGESEFRRDVARSLEISKPRPVVKRSDRERVEALARRFWSTVKDNPNVAPALLREIQAEYWKAGDTVSYEDMRLAAIELLKKAAIEEIKKGKA